jgi:hypothetical protein
MKLFEIVCSGAPYIAQIPTLKGMFCLQQKFWAEFVTDNGVFKLDLFPGWITDYRSGSSIVDAIVPKKGNEKYNATIFMHDACYSGHLSKKLADFFLLEGMKMAGIASWRAQLAYEAVRIAGASSYFALDDTMPRPYRYNRDFERLHINARAS